MESLPGKMWLYSHRGQLNEEWEKSGIPVTDELWAVQPNDCVMPITNPMGKAISQTPGDRGRSLRQGQQSPWIMNEAASRIGCLSSAELERRLRREGLPARIETADRNGTPITVSVWGLDAIEMRRLFPVTQKFNGIKYSAGLSENANYAQGHAIWKPAERLSVRALYLLGLDFGQVELSLSEKGRLTVKGISTEMKVTGEAGKLRLAEVLSSFAASWSNETASGAQAKLGADPEFILISPEGRIVPASRYFSPEGAAGCDSIRIRGEKRWPLVELRPRPSKDPALLISDVHRLLQVAAEKTAGVALSWLAGALPVPGLPLGGHVHLSGVALTGERLRALDNAVALPLRLLEPPLAASRRPRYGALGDVRRQPHGGFEYRTPPSWLVSPRLALGAFALAKVAAEHSRELAVTRPLDDDRCRDAFYGGDRTLLLKAAHSIYEAISRTSGYASYKEPIDFLFQAIARERSWDETADIRLKWRIPIG
ncbi:putative amidoligase domain-containing protein [Cohnella luojiensis]|nr:hypothetical protein [Cohnella luojiensis]